MAEPLGLVGVIGVVTQIVQISARLGLDWKNAPSDAKKFQQELQALKTILSETYTNILLNSNFKKAFEDEHSTLLSELGNDSPPTNTKEMLMNCRTELEAILGDLKKRSQGHKFGWERLKGAFLAKGAREAVENLSRQCQALNAMSTIDSVALTGKTYVRVEESHSFVNELYQSDIRNQKEVKKRAVLEWLTPVDYTAQQNDTFCQREEGTCQWFLTSAEYLRWANNVKQTLFCPGIPGAGKTTLTSIVINDLETRFSGQNVAVAYIYCNFQRQDEQTAAILLCSILKQLSKYSASLPEAVELLYANHKRKSTRPSINELLNTIQSVLRSYSRVFIVIDALDECNSKDDSLRTILPKIFDLQTRFQVNMMATSRPITEIMEVFKSGIFLEIRASDQDVHKYLEHHIPNLSKCVTSSPKLQNEIIMTITKVIDGMFLLARLYLESLKGKRSSKAIRTALKQLPSGSDAYDRVYEAAMQRIEGQIPEDKELAKEVLSWICCAQRPLTVTEVEHALAVEIGTKQFDTENIIPVDDMISVCIGLITVDEESQVFRLIHYTTQQYFNKTKERWFSQPDTEISRKCCTYLSYDNFSDGPCETVNGLLSRFTQNQFFDYAACSWGHHVRRSSMVCQEVFAFLALKQHVEASYQAMLFGEKEPIYKVDRLFSRHDVNELHLAVYLGVDNLVKELVSAGIDINVRDRYHRTPLHLAAYNGHGTIIRLLLDTNAAEVNATNLVAETPIHLAVRKDRLEAVKLLLNDNKVDVNARCSAWELVPLHEAVEFEHEAIVKLLLEANKVEINAKDFLDRTPLYIASRRGYKAIVKMLLDTRQAETNLAAGDGNTPLDLAKRMGHETIVKMLTDYEKQQSQTKRAIAIESAAATQPP